MQWTDRIRQVKILLVISAIVIAATSLLVSHYLVRDLQVEERKKMEVWAEAMHAFNQATDSTDLTLVTRVIEGNNTIPVIVMDEQGMVADWRNIDIDGKDTLSYLSAYGKKMKAAGNVIKIEFWDEYLYV
jgi:hypothetical protein